MGASVIEALRRFLPAFLVAAPPLSGITDLLDQAISGYVEQVIADGGDTTITIPDGSTGVARNMYLELTGALSAARNLIVPAYKKLYFIYNNTTDVGNSGPYAVTIKVSGQTGVSVPNGKKTILVCNGTDIVEAVTYFASFQLTNIDNTPIAATTPSTGAFTRLNVTGNTVPANGVYLSAANTLAFSSNTTARGTVNSTGNWVISAPSSGTALYVNGVSGYRPRRAARVRSGRLSSGLQHDDYGAWRPPCFNN